MTFTESTIEQAAIDWLKDLGYDYAFGPEIAFDGERPDRADYQDPPCSVACGMPLPASTPTFRLLRVKKPFAI
jgi:hypothetical protein